MTSDNPNVPTSPNEMVDAWVKAAQDAERRWNEFFNQMMGTDAFAQAMSRSQESAAAMQAAFARGIEPYLRAANVPTQAELARLAERITALERRLDALTANDVKPAARPAGRTRSGTSGGKRRSTSQSAG